MKLLAKNWVSWFRFPGSSDFLYVSNNCKFCAYSTSTVNQTLSASKRK